LNELIKMQTDNEIPTERGSGDAVLMTDADRIEHANEMGTSELY